MEEKYYWSAKESGFYPESMRELYENSADGWPDDATEISEELYQSLLTGQLKGKVITSDSGGNPVLTAPVIDWNARAESKRQSLLTSANSKNSFWQTKLLAGKTLTNEQKSSLDAWLDYMDKLEALELASVADEAGYKAIEWPVSP
ncbi:tail fiber assembly protein [Enterobacter asburiae]